MLEFAFDKVPTWKRPRRKGHAYFTDETNKEFYATFQRYFLAMRDPKARYPFDKPIDVQIEVPLKRAKGDPDNYLKLFLDALVKAGIIWDDRAKFFNNIQIKIKPDGWFVVRVFEA